MLLAGVTGMLVLAYPLFRLFQLDDVRADLVAEITFAVLYATQAGSLPVLITELLPARVRNTGFAASYNLAASVFGGTAAPSHLLIAVSGYQAATSL